MVHLKAQSFVAFKVFQAVNCLAVILTSSGLHYTEISELFSYIRKAKNLTKDKDSAWVGNAGGRMLLHACNQTLQRLCLRKVALKII